MNQESDELIRYVTDLEEVNQELVTNLLKRVATLEEISSQLATDLKSCVGLLKVFKEAVPNPEEWEDMLDTLESYLQVAETVRGKKMFNQTGDQRKRNHRAPEQSNPWHLVPGVTAQGTVTTVAISRPSDRPRSALIIARRLKGRDIHKLDRDGDGRVCESLP